MLSSETQTESHFGGSSIKSSTKETLLGVLNDFELQFDEHILLICSKVRSRLNALGRIANFMSYVKRHVITEASIPVQQPSFDMEVPFPSIVQQNKLSSGKGFKNSCLLRLQIISQWTSPKGYLFYNSS